MSTLGFGLGSSLSALGVSAVTTPHMSWTGRADDTMTVDPDTSAYMASPQNAIDTVGVTPLLEGYRAFFAEVAETVGVEQQEEILRGIVLAEQLRLSETWAGNSSISPTLDETLALTESILTGFPATLEETIGANIAVVVQQACTVIESLGLTDIIAPLAIYGRSLAETVELTTSLANFFGADALETVGIQELSTVQLSAAGNITESVELADTTSGQLLIRVVAAESIEITPVQAVQALYQDIALEEIEISIGYLSPGDSFTTWSMNTRSGAVTEYSNYAFNSFARVGNKYLAASSSGVYELSGDTDAGAAIIATLKGGYLQFGGTHLSRLKEAYIAATGDEDTFILRVETLDGDTYTYQVDTRSGRNTKVHMGKGQRARYFAYTLVSTGQDFTLDTLEFVPIVVQRRV